MAGLIGLGQTQRGRAANALSKSSELEFQRNQGNMAMDSARSAQKKQTLGMGAGMGAYYGVSQAGTAAAAGGSAAAGGTATAGTIAVPGFTSAAAGGSAAGGTAAAGGSAALSTAASAIPYVAAGLAIAALFNKLF